MEPPKADILAGYGRARHALDAWLENATAADLRRRSNGTRWTNEELLFHMVFGYMVVRALLPMVHVISRLPQPVGTAFAAVLNAGTRPFDVVNYWGSRGRDPRLQQATDGPETRQNHHRHQPPAGTRKPHVAIKIDAIPGPVGPVLRPDDDTQRRLRLPHASLRLPRPAADSQSSAPIGEESSSNDGRSQSGDRRARQPDEGVRGRPLRTGSGPPV